MSTAARWLILAHLIASPVLFWRATTDTFLFIKAVALIATATALAALGVAAVILRNARPARLDLCDVGVAAMLASAALSTACSVCPLFSFLGHPDSQTGFVTLAALMVLFVTIRRLFTQSADVHRFLLTAGIGASLAAGYGLVQLAGADRFSWEGLSVAAGRVRPFGSVGHPNHLAAVLAMSVPVLAGLSWTSRHRGATAMFGLGAVGAVAVCVATLSRGGWLALAVGLGVLAGFGGRRVAALGGLGVLVAVIVFGSTIQDRLIRVDDPRPHLWGAALKVFRDRPMLGGGPDTFALTFPTYRSPEYNAIEWNHTPRHVHNDFLELLATQGLLGVASLILFGAGFAQAVRDGWRHDDGDHQQLRVLALAGLAAFVVQGWFNFLTPSVGVLAVSMAAIASGRRTEDGESKAEPGPVVLGWFVGAATVGFAVVAWPLRADLNVAAGHPDRAVKLTPWNPAAWVALADTVDDPCRAVAAFERAAELVPLDATLRMRLALARATAGQDPIPDLDTALKLEPNNPVFWSEAARTALGVRRLDRASVYADRARQLDPGFGPAAAWSAFVELAKRHYLAAALQLETALRLDWHGDDDAFWRAWSAYGAALEGCGRLDDARWAYRHVLAHRPNHASVHAALQRISLAP